MVIEYSLPHI